MGTTTPEKQSAFATEPIGKLIVRFAIPSVIALLVNSLYNIVDQIFIGWGVGYLGNGATNIVFPITIIALALSMMIGNGGASYLSLKLGEGKAADAQKGVGNAAALIVLVSIVLTAAFLLFINPILTLFGATDILRPYALDYGCIIGIGLPFMMISAAINSMIRAAAAPNARCFPWSSARSSTSSSIRSLSLSSIWGYKVPPSQPSLAKWRPLWFLWCICPGSKPFTSPLQHSV